MFGVTVDWLLDPTVSELGTEHMQKHRRKINWGYPIYLLCVALVFFGIMVVDVTYGMRIDIGRLAMFFDVPMLFAMVIGGILFLAVTGQMKAFGRTFSHAFFKNARPEPKAKKATNMAVLGIVLLGTAYMICFTIHIIHDMNGTFFSAYAEGVNGFIGVIVNMWLLFAFYMITALFILLPLRFRQA